jgi:hypothetical protein
MEIISIYTRLFSLDFPDFYYAHSYWQYSYTARVDGIGGYVDLDLQFT